MDLLKEVDEQVLKDIGVSSAGHRLRIRSAISKLDRTSRTEAPANGDIFKTEPAASAERRQPWPDQGGQILRAQSVRPEYVEFIPKALEDGVLYISRKFKTASHPCCCGCGTKIVTPLRETEYSLIDRRGVISLHPSIGNWIHPCQSHYWIRDNRVLWAGAMSRAEIHLGRACDDAIKKAYFAKVAWPWWRRLASRLNHWIGNFFG